ncbi:hypothetical protein PROVALCAL_01536 [Providencia alcalifaciens DSM 30120]|uniref:Uncharacterized protein n=1 Tax=Providencia alcalifaciens DSM 30120 TaxID=520999 RepID=B6XDW1_9GAMM|nr:hypothetical protein PROVALCAL_01536 [Providencia alcalifaciens DSM 30120]
MIAKVVFHLIEILAHSFFICSPCQKPRKYFRGFVVQKIFLSGYRVKL